MKTSYLEDPPVWITCRVKIFKRNAGFYTGVNFRLWVDRQNTKPLEVQCMFGISFLNDAYLSTLTQFSWG